MDETLVMKFGGASMQAVSQFKKIAHLVKTRKENFSRIVVVVSAMGSMTDDLMELARSVHPHPPKREQDMLVSIGERVSISLLAMALGLEGIEAVSFTGSQSGIITTSDHTQAKIVEVRPRRILKTLSENKIAIVAGFQGMSVEGEITTLGRDGSDLSAVAMGAAVGAKVVEFYKDVEGIGEVDPKTKQGTKIFNTLSYEKALTFGGLHPECIEMAKAHQIELQIRPYFDPERVGTKVGDYINTGS